ncbi:MAG TPA: ABC transporter ATP-binding protein [Acidimicrobiia bacterium]|nr:ABC transporter ATP-binding protein [Acidimicrobiia bacterium]
MADPLLQVDMLQAGYGQSTVLDGLSFSMGTESVAIIGRNGMGKTTLCKTIMGLVRPTRGSVVFDGQDLTALPPEKTSRAGIAYVPQGRRLFPSLTVDEHLRMLANGTKGKRWTADAVYELFPRLAQRRQNRGGDLSGGEQQMLAVGRALMLNSKLVLMDEPSEGLAPTIVETLIAAVHTLVAEGVAVLAVEQNIHAATAMADRQLAMVSGRIEAEFGGEEIRNDPTLQRLYLGVDA